MPTLSINKSELLRRMELLSKESQEFVFNKISELNEAEKKDEELLQAIRIGEESGVSNIVDVRAYIEQLYNNAKSNSKNA